MLETGLKLLDCEVIAQISENDAYQSYRVNYAGNIPARLLLALREPLSGQKNPKTAVDHANWLASQSFPCIGVPLRAGEHEGRLACVYPLPAGIPLSEASAAGYSVRQALELVRQAAECLSVPHSAGLRHGNLSPATIFLPEQGLFLADFSLVQLISLDYHSGIDPYFTSPEQVRGEAPGTPSDIYNLGCILFYLLTGSSPYTGNDAFSIALQHVQGQFPLLKEQLSACQPLMDGLTELSMDKRLTADELVTKIELLLADPQIDQLSCPATREKEKIVESGAPQTPLEAVAAIAGHSELAARIEAKLKESSLDVKGPVASDQAGDPREDDIAGLGKAGTEPKSRRSRFALLLLTGVAVGTVMYFLLFTPREYQLSGSVVESVQASSVDLDRGLRLWEAADRSAAETEFKKLIKKSPQDPRAYNNLAALYASQGDYQQALKYLEMALETDQGYAVIYRNLGTVYAEMARDSYVKALQLNEMPPLISLKIFSSQGIVAMASPVESGGAEQSRPHASPQPSVDLPLSAGPPGIVMTGVDSAAELSTGSVSAVKARSLNPDKERSEPGDEAREPVKDAASTEPQALTEATTGAIMTAEMNRKKSAEEFMHRWARAWSEQDVEAYLGFYGATFSPPGGKSRAEWEAQRRSRLANPQKIEVTLEEIKFTAEENNRLRLDIIQSYKSDLFSDRTRKAFEIVQVGTEWEILSERSLGRIR